MTNLTFDYLKDVKKIGFLGFGKSNRALLQYLSKRFSFEAVIRDERESVDAPAGVRLFLGKECFTPCGEDVIFLSPSVRRERECVKRLANSGAVLSSDAELFFSEVRESVFAVSGSDGKSTTSALAGEILRASGKKCFVVGNFGLPLTPLSDERRAYFVTELSSFMLSYFSPASRRALITNITPNHLNWHASLDEYIMAKEHILENTRERVFSFDCEVSRGLIKKHGAFAVFSVMMPYSELKELVTAQAYATLENGELKINGEGIMKSSELIIPGIHNVKNALAALSLTYGFCDTGAAKSALSAFGGLPHRCKRIFSSGGIGYYDSSIDSSPLRTRATLELFERPVTLILGGRDKGLDYSPLLEAVRSHAGAVILCGENAERIAELLSSHGVAFPIFFAGDYEAAVQKAREIGFDVLLSPASTSYDRFSSFEERGSAFFEAIKSVYKQPVSDSGKE